MTTISPVAPSSDCTSDPLRSSWRVRRLQALLLLPPLLLASVVLSIGGGAMAIPPLEVVAILLSKLGLPAIAPFSEEHALVLEAVRLPRVLMSVLVGATLAVCGAAMQGLFRNPLADPGLLGLSSGAALAASICIVFGANVIGLFSLPMAAFAGSLASTALIYFFAQERGRIAVTTMLLGGIAINALCQAGTGLVTFLASDEQLQNITFWQLGSLGGVTWSSFRMGMPFMLLCLLAMPLMAGGLNALLLGESEARHLGIRVEWVKAVIVTLVALGVGAAVSVAGTIGFVGLVVPHLIRLWIGPNHKTLLIASAALGATLVTLADLLARTLVAPQEMPIGILTAVIGAPFFLFLLWRGRKAGQL